MSQTDWFARRTMLKWKRRNKVHPGDKLFSTRKLSCNPKTIVIRQIFADVRVETSSKADHVQIIIRGERRYQRLIDASVSAGACMLQPTPEGARLLNRQNSWQWWQRLWRRSRQLAPSGDELPSVVILVPAAIGLHAHYVQGPIDTTRASLATVTVSTMPDQEVMLGGVRGLTAILREGSVMEVAEANGRIRIATDESCEVTVASGKADSLTLEAGKFAKVGCNVSTRFESDIIAAKGATVSCDGVAQDVHVDARPESNVTLRAVRGQLDAEIGRKAQLTVRRGALNNAHIAVADGATFSASGEVNGNITCSPGATLVIPRAGKQLNVREIIDLP